MTPSPTFTGRLVYGHPAHDDPLGQKLHLDFEAAMAVERIGVRIDAMAARAHIEIGILAAAHRSAMAGKDFERSMGALRRWRLPKGGDHA